MTVKPRSARSNPRLALRNTLLIGASVSTLIISGAALAQSRSVFGSRGGTADPAAAAARAAQDQATRAAQTNSASQRAVAAFRRAADTRVSMQAAQVAARAAAQAAQSSVPNGLGAGGLQVANGVTTDPSLWVGANGPVQSAGTGGRTNVTIDQTQQKAILSWDSFNVGRETDLAFNQGGADWVALNRVTSASADPSKILGSIKAQGSVYLINRNGILFGGASQINVHSLLASTANITDGDFLNRGIYSALSGANYLPSFTNAGGKVTVEAGALITTSTPTSVTAGGGFVLLMGTQVRNEGTITTPRGQAALAAGDNFILRRGFGTEENLQSTTRGNEVRGLLTAGSTSGAVTNAGLIEAREGDVTLAGRTIRQEGVALATTSVNQRGTIHLLNSASDTHGSVSLGKDSLTTILPELDSKATALNGQRDALIAQSDTANNGRLLTITGGFDDRSLLADRLDQSRVEIVTGGSVLFESGSQTIAQGGQVAVQANAGRITVADGALIDVAGVMGVALDMASNAIKVNVQGNELRDSPANREGSGLKSQNVWIDVRDLVLLPSGTGGYEGDRWYTPGGLLEVGGYLSNVAHGIGEWTAVGGTITLAGKEVIAHKGATFDISGGSLDYASGYVQSTRVMGADGRMYDVRNAPANMTFVAVGNAFMRKHERWGEQYTQVYSNPLFSRGNASRWEEGYSVGRDAGKLILSAPTVVMEAEILAEVINGERQTSARADGITDGYKLGEHSVARGGVLAIGGYTAYGNTNPFNMSIRIGDVEGVAGDLTNGAALPGDRVNSVQLDAGYLNAQKLGGLELATRGTIGIERDLTLADGGQLSLVAPVINVAATVTARGGTFDTTNLLNRDSTVIGLNRDPLLLGGKSGFTLAGGGVIDLRGLWLNGGSASALPGGLGLIDGGAASVEFSGNVTIAAGSRIDVSSGGAVLPLGETHGGRGGDVSLIADTTRIVSNQGRLTLDGAIAGYGVTGGGTLTLVTGGKIAIGGAGTAPDTLTLSPDQFSSGFSAYDVNGQGGLRVTEGATVDVRMPVYRFLTGSMDAPTGTDPAAALELWTPPVWQEDPQAGQLIQRGGASLTLKAQRDFRGSTLEIGKGATVSVDPGQRIDVISSSQMTLDGRLNAWGGTIRFDAPRIDGAASAPEHYRSIWIGETGVIDVAGRSFSAVDAQGRRYGVVQDGGTIELGGGLDWEDPEAINGLTPDLHLVIRPGAVLDASGASAVFDLPGLEKGSAIRPVTVASDGGLISLKWGNSLYLDGTIRAAAGGTGASGGTLAVSGGGGLYSRANAVGAVMNSRNLLLTQTQGADLLGSDIEVGDKLTYGSARLSAEQIAAGGFDNLALASALLVNDDFSLTMRQSFRTVNQFAVAAGAADGRRIDISAPYIKLGSQGTAREPIATELVGAPSLGQIATRNDIAHFEADHIDLAGRVAYLGYADLSLTATGDIRLLKPNEAIGGNATTLMTSDRMTLTAAQVYAATDTTANISVGRDTGTAFASPDDPDDAIIIRSHGGPAPAVPYSANSRLNLVANIIEQGGVLRAPLGSIELGNIDHKPTIRFLPGSLTSVSGAGLVMPYGGTIDGVKYNYDGDEVAPAIIGGASIGFYGRNLTLNGADIIVEKGAVLDMTGGGDLRGIGFISGRGGSVDVLQTPFANANPAFGFSSADNQVYALVPGFTAMRRSRRTMARARRKWGGR